MMMMCIMMGAGTSFIIDYMDIKANSSQFFSEIFLLFFRFRLEQLHLSNFVNRKMRKHWRATESVSNELSVSVIDIRQTIPRTASGKIISLMWNFGENFDAHTAITKEVKWNEMNWNGSSILNENVRFRKKEKKITFAPISFHSIDNRSQLQTINLVWLFR